MEYYEQGAVTMSRKKKLINNTTIPQYAIERFARCVFAQWLAEREQNKKTRVAKAATLVSISGNKQIIRTRFRFGRYGSDYIALAKVLQYDTILEHLFKMQRTLAQRCTLIKAQHAFSLIILAYLRESLER